MNETHHFPNRWVWLFISIVLNLVIGFIGLGLIVLMHSNGTVLGIGTSLVAAAVAAIILSSYQYLLDVKNEITLSKLFKDVQDTIERRSAVEWLDDPETVYEKANNVITSSTKEAILTTDFRWFSRSETDSKFQSDYLDHMISHMERLPNSRTFRAIAAQGDEEDTMRTLAAKLLNNDKIKKQVALKYYLENPVVLDLLIGDYAVLFAIPDPTKLYRSGLLIWDQRIADRLRAWYLSVVWTPDHISRPKEIKKRKVTLTFSILLSHPLGVKIRL